VFRKAATDSCCARHGTRNIVPKPKSLPSPAGGAANAVYATKASEIGMLPLRFVTIC